MGEIAARAPVLSKGSRVTSMYPARIRLPIILATVGLAAATLVGCAASDADSSGASEEMTESTTEETPADEGSAEPAGETDCAAVRDTLVAWLDASFAGMSTEITNGEVAVKYQTAADTHANAAVTGAKDWELLGQVINEYASEWSQFPADAAAIDNIEVVEDHVDDYAEGLGFDNDDFDEMFPTVSQTCADVFAGLAEE